MVALAIVVGLAVGGEHKAVLATGLLEIGSFVAFVMAAVRRERLSPERLGRWDEAALLFLASRIASLWVDPSSLT